MRVSNRLGLGLVVSLCSLSLCEGVFAQNLAEPFDRDLTGWSFAAGTAEWSRVDSSQLSTSGSAKLTNLASDHVGISRCIAITSPISNYVAGARARLGDGLTSAAGHAQLSLLFFNTSDCSGNSFDGVNLGLTSGTSWNWGLFSLPFSPARTDIHSVSVTPTLYRASAGGVTAYVDDVLFGINTAAAFGQGRFSAGVAWKTKEGRIGLGNPVELTADSSYFWFFAPTNVELVVKVLNACTFNNRYWIFAGGLTNVETLLDVVDTQARFITGYINFQGNAFQPVQDTNAFPSCP
ncbi:MAG TPA: hypothetical protein VLX28_19275 [Thermoanaerobaculia bacterium]|nr:hypothetical protein [Thermoanaerobaculia bacterium]